MQPFYQFIQDAQTLLESPQYVDHDYDDPDELTQPDLYSDKTLSDQFTYIGTIEGRLETVELYIQELHSIYCVIGVRSTYEHEKYKRCMFSMKLNELNYVDDSIKQLGTKYLAVSLVHCQKDYRFSNIATQSYLLLSKLGYVIISDELQYKGAKSLWKKLATIGLANVRVFDQDSDKFIIGNNNSEIYNGTNIDDSVIWGNSDKMSILLILSTK